MKHLLTTTALVIAMAGGAHAETATTGFGQVAMQQGDFYASKLIGMHIYNSKTRLEANSAIAKGGEADWENIGDINDILITKDGKVSAVILGVGGFLGIGEHDVAVPMNEITIVHETDDPDDRFLVISTTKEALEQIPAFKRDNHIADTNTTNGVATDQTSGTNTVQLNDGAVRPQSLTRPAVNREGYTDLDMSSVHQLTADDLQGAPVYGADDKKVGDVGSLIVGEDGKINEVVVNVGGFLGMGERSVAVTFDELQIMKENDGNDVRIYIDSTKDALKALPEYKG